MTNVGYSHNFNRCHGNHYGLRRGLCSHKVRMHSNDPRAVCENFTGSRSIWIRRGADRHRDKRWPQDERR